MKAGCGARGMRSLLFFASVALLASSGSVAAQEGEERGWHEWHEWRNLHSGRDGEDWHEWLEHLRADALAEGIAPQTFAAALGGVVPDERVLAADREQPEFTRPIWEYLDSAVSARRIRKGREMLARHGDLLREIARRHGVPATILVAIWGIETNYGGNMGSFHVPRSLATLAYGSERRGFGRRQLLAALRLLQEGAVAADAMNGSWAGAMGHMQFLPVTYERYGVDFDGDGRRDLFAGVSDALASAAGYLHASGWRAGEIWGMEVILPAGFEYGLARGSVRKSGAEWARLGVRGAGGGALPAEAGSVLLPAGYRGAAFLVLENFSVLKRYNPSTAYALAVGRLADCLLGCDALAGRWPVEDGVLGFSEKEALQRRLTALGYDLGEIDGIVGPATREALRGWQAARGLAVDGYPTRALLRQMEAEAGR